MLKIFNEDTYNYFIVENKINIEEKNEKIISNNMPKNKVIEKKEIEENSSKVNDEDNKKKQNILNTEEEIIAYEILKKSEFRILINKNELIYDDINYGNSKIKINEKFQQINKYFEANKTESVLSKNYHKFIKFLKEFEKYLKKEFNLKYNLRIDLNFEKENNNNDETYNIKCNYILYNPDSIEDDKQFFMDDNILINRINSILRIFLICSSNLGQRIFCFWIDYCLITNNIYISFFIGIIPCFHTCSISSKIEDTR